VLRIKAFIININSTFTVFNSALTPALLPQGEMDSYHLFHYIQRKADDVLLSPLLFGIVWILQLVQQSKKRNLKTSMLEMNKKYLIYTSSEQLEI
jgi:hypothetical protein